ncbi:hypothetical protein [Actinoplanes sp. NPDC051494]|uniref:hypothetical protein n=1 Tax=Actinoplanes sp. NPDC051494 TaxID=3363907 RepID=UPI00379F5E03
MRLHTAVHEAFCARRVANVCDRAGLTGPGPDAGAADVAVVRQALIDAGDPPAVVRLAGARDPAPDGTVVYGVRLAGDVCAVAYVQYTVGVRPRDLVGLLPGGVCLAG